MLLGVALGTACATPNPPAAPEQPSAVRFTLDGAVRLRVLGEQTVRRAKPPPFALAEKEGELASLWDELGLKGAAPTVDFAQELVMAFSEGGFCNDGKLRAVVLTASGALVPEVHSSHMVCALLGYECNVSRVYVAALPRAYFEAGAYTFRHGREPERFELGPHRSMPVTARSELPLSPPPGTHEAPGPRHRRRARVTFEGGGEDPGVWVRSDAAWLPASSFRDRARHRSRAFAEEELFVPELVCDARACSRAVANAWCQAPECPAVGLLVFTERPVATLGPWPREPGAWERLMVELSRDPALQDELGAPPSSYARLSRCASCPSGKGVPEPWLRSRSE